MFNNFMKLARQGDFTVAVRATGPDKDVLTMIVAPIAKEGQEPALAQPIRLSGTVAELEQGFAQAIDKFVTSRAELMEQVDATLAILEEAKKVQANKATTALKKQTVKPQAAEPKRGATPTSPELDDDDDDVVGPADGQDDSATAGGTPPSGTPASTLSAPNLFG